MTLDTLPYALCVWLVAAFLATLAHARSVPTAGLLAAYLFSLWLIHWPGAALYALPWYTTPAAQVVADGFTQALLAVLGLLLGVLLLRLLVGSRPTHSGSPTTGQAQPDLGLRYLIAGFVGYGFFLFSPMARIPTVGALVSIAAQLVVVGLCLKARRALQTGSRMKVAGWLAVSAILPVITVLFQGFLGFGVGPIMILLAFTAMFYRPRWHLVVMFVALSWVGLSLYETYMRDRAEIRSVVWGGQDLEARVNVIRSSLSAMELFDVTNPVHLARIDDRLNQNVLVGAAVGYLELDRVGRFAEGATLWEALIAVVPRVFWPDKPVSAGSGNLVSTYTGLTFDLNTSVGIGHVLEFYVNFGSVGVIVGFVVLGLAVAAVDRAAGQALVRGDEASFCRWFLPGMALLVTGGSLVELTASVGAAVMLLALLHPVLIPSRLRRAQIAGRSGFASGS